MSTPTSIVADENIPNEVVTALRESGCRVFWIAAERKGITDQEVWQIAAARQAVLLTRDKGFLPQLSREEVLNGPRVVVYRSDGIEADELRSSELFAQVMAWYVRDCSNKAWEYVELHFKGTRRSKRECWGTEQRRRRSQG